MSDEKKWTVYVHINKDNGKRYFGITSKEPERRWRGGSGYCDSPHFYAAINKYGWDGFDHVILYTGLSCDEAKLMEQKLIAEFNTMDREFGYNMTKGGDGTAGYHPSEETRRKQSESRRRENLSEETIRRKSEAMKTRKLSDDHKKKIGIGNSKMVKMLDMAGNLIKIFSSAREAEIDLGINHSHISQCCNGIRNSTGGYMWQFA